MARASILSFEPDNCVEFTYDFTSYTGTVTLANTSEFPVAFKIKTTCPTRYLVRPNQGVLSSHTEDLVVKIVVQGEALDALCNELVTQPGVDYSPQDRFLVQYLALTPTEFSSLSSEEPEGLQRRLSSLWSNPQYRTRLQNHKMSCVYRWSDSFGKPNEEEPEPEYTIQPPAPISGRGLSTPVEPVLPLRPQSQSLSLPAPSPSLSPTFPPAPALPPPVDLELVQQIKDLQDANAKLAQENAVLSEQRAGLAVECDMQTRALADVRNELAALRALADTNKPEGLRKRTPEERVSKPEAAKTTTAAAPFPRLLALLLLIVGYLLGRILA